MLDPANNPQQVQSLDVGRRLRELRTLAGLSIRSLAEKSGLNFNTLSLIENNRSSPSVSTLQQLAGALQVPITAFFETATVQQEVVFQKHRQRPQSMFAHGLLEDLGAGLTLGNGLPLLLTLQPGADSGSETIVHTGQEFVFCLAGGLEYSIDGNEFHLSAGDSLLFQAHLPHRWGNRGTVDARFILVLCPADENDQLADRHFQPGLVKEPPG
ncbi:MAG: cupin domain-containing protein [Burkholderiales bacterium]|nr:MAG: cupin domain-containing protein [Burkholderiales bacterium]